MSTTPSAAAARGGVAVGAALCFDGAGSDGPSVTLIVVKSVKESFLTSWAVAVKLASAIPTAPAVRKKTLFTFIGTPPVHTANGG